MTAFNMPFLPILRFFVQILVLWWLLYWGARLLKGTAGLTQVVFIFVFLLFSFGLSHFFQLHVLEFIVVNLFYFLPILLIVLYHTEIRHIIGTTARKLKFIRLTKGNSMSAERLDDFIDTICVSVGNLSETKTGALIAIEQFTPLSPYSSIGKKLNLDIVPKLLETIFFKGTPLHDGGVIIRRGKIEAAACQFPLSMKDDIRDRYGMRHQAAMGLSEETDAIIIVVSEENGLVHLVQRETMDVITDVQELNKQLRERMASPSDKNKELAAGKPQHVK